MTLLNPLATTRQLVFLTACLALSLPAIAAVPQALNHQGRIAVNGVNYDGNGQFKFALVNVDGTVSYWSNDETSQAGSEPTAAVALAVTKGLYAVLLGDAALPNMTVVPTSAVDHADVRLRVWFNDGSNGSQLMTPDQRLAASPFALVAGTAASATTAGSATNFSGSLLGEVTGTQGATTISAATITGKALTGFVSDAGTLSASDTLLSALNKLDGNTWLKAPLANPTFTGTVSGITASMVGLGSVNNTADSAKSVSYASTSGSATTATTAGSATSFTGPLAGDVTGTQAATAIADTTVTGKVLTGYVSGAGTIAETDTVLSAVNKLNGNNGLKANLASPTFSGIPSAPTPVALTNTTQIATTAFVQTAIGDLIGSTTGMLATLDALKTTLGDGSVVVTLTNDLSLKAPIASPAFTGTVSGVTASMVGLGNVANTSDEDKPVSTAQQTALNLRAPLASPTFTGTVSGSFSGPLAGNATTATSATTFSGSLVGDITGTQDATAIAATTVTGKALTGYVSGSGTISTADTVLSAINKLNGNDGLKANLASPTFTGTVTGSFSGPLSGNATTATNATNAGSATNFSGSLGGDVTGTQGTTAIAAATVTGKALTGYVSGAGTLSATDTVLSAVQKLNGNDGLKASLASPTFTGTVALPAGTTSAAPLQLATGTNLTTAVFGSVEFDGMNLYLTTNAASPIRKTVTLSDTGSSAQIALTSVVAAPVKPVVAWGNNTNGQTTVPTPLSNVVAVAAGDSHSLALLGAGTVLAWGNNTSGQRTVPVGLSGVTEIAAGASHNLVRKSNGTLVAWGGNSYGQTTIPAGITTATKVAAGEKHSLALLANGSIQAWGDNSFGQTALPSALTGVTVTAIAAGYDHCLALTSGGTVVAWGRSDAGQTSVPSSLTGVIAIAAGAYHSLALKSDGTVVAWGYDSGGQVSLLPAGLSGVVKISGGYTYSMALKSDGTLVVWGNTGTPDWLSTLPVDATQVTAIAAGGYHALALRANLISAQVARLDQDNVFSGKVGIKRTPATNALEVEGTASKTTASSWLANSDRRIKTEIESITGALEKLDQVRLVDFRYTDAYRAAHPSIEDVRYPNVIAQEFATVFPDNVKSSGELMPDGSPILQVDTYPLTIYSAAAVQELHRENQALKQQVADQERRLRQLEAMFAK